MSATQLARSCPGSFISQGPIASEATCANSRRSPKELIFELHFELTAKLIFKLIFELLHFSNTLTHQTV